MRPVRNQKVARSNLNALFFKGDDLLHEADGVNDHPVTDYVLFVRPEDSGRNKVENILVFTNDDGVSCIVSSLPPDNEIRIFRKIVDDLSLSLVTPLKSVNDRVHEKIVAWR